MTTNLFLDAPFDVRRRLEETFKKFNVSQYQYREVLGQTLIRLENVNKTLTPNLADTRAMAIFRIFQYYKSLK